MYTVSTGLALATCQMFDEDGTPLVLSLGLHILLYPSYQIHETNAI